eukprot:12926438-Prorocentrum_lima.AAC.1
MLLPDEDLTTALPLHAKSPSCTLRTILFCGPHYMRDGGMKIGGQWVRRPTGTTYRGMWPEFWRSLSTAKRAQL